jgi:hypothetical protein
MTTSTATEMTPATAKLFKELCEDACNWAGFPMIDVNASTRGNLTDLKKMGLITTFKDDGILWADFTEAGKAKAKEMHGIDIAAFYC